MSSLMVMCPMSASSSRDCRSAEHRQPALGGEAVEDRLHPALDVVVARPEHLRVVRIEGAELLVEVDRLADLHSALRGQRQMQEKVTWGEPPRRSDDDR